MLPLLAMIGPAMSALGGAGAAAGAAGGAGGLMSLLGGAGGLLGGAGGGGGGDMAKAGLEAGASAPSAGLKSEVPVEDLQPTGGIGGSLFGVDIDDPRMKMAVENLQAKSNGGKHASMGMNAPAAPQAGLGSDIGLRGLMGSTALQQINNPQRQQFQRNRSNIRSLMGG